VASTISESAEGLSASNLLLASQIAQKGLKRASGEIEALPIENIADVERIFKMAALAGKWSQPQVQINQAFAFGGGQEDQNIIECETEIVEDVGNYGDSFNL
jgi:protein involved in temperature-dependent protein secretion